MKITTILVDSSVGTNSGFSGAFLQGTNLATAESFQGISLADAFVDFSAQGNTILLSLIRSSHNPDPRPNDRPQSARCAFIPHAGPLNDLEGFRSGSMNPEGT